MTFAAYVSHWFGWLFKTIAKVMYKYVCKMLKKRAVLNNNLTLE